MVSHACEIVLYACDQWFRSTGMRHTHNGGELAGIVYTVIIFKSDAIKDMKFKQTCYYFTVKDCTYTATLPKT